MRFITLIFATFILYLSCMPCPDNQSCGSTAGQSISSTHNEAGHQHEEEGDLCTPFCVCSCCGNIAVVISIPHFVIDPKPALHPVSPISTYQSIFISSYSFSFWQPPKI